VRIADVEDVAGVLLEGRIVNEDVDPAKCRQGLLDGTGTKAGLCHVSRDQNAASALRFDAALGLLRILVLVEVDNGNVRPFAGVDHGNGAPDAGVASRDDGRHVLKLA